MNIWENGLPNFQDCFFEKLLVFSIERDFSEGPPPYHHQSRILEPSFEIYRGTSKTELLHCWDADFPRVGLKMLRYPNMLF